MMLTTSLLDINLLAVLVAGIVHTVIGLIWFMPQFFGNAWVKLTGKEMKPASQWIAAGLIGHQVMAFVLAVIVNLANVVNAVGGIFIGVLVCIGFVIPLEISELIWEKIPFKLFMIRVGNQLVGLSLAGSILAVWQ
ncbi:MAG: DUF1761 domain-containing protein [Anaerolineales bacterium]